MALYLLFRVHKASRTEFPWNFILLGLLIFAQALFLGGLCSHSYISTLVLAGLALSTGTVAAAAIWTTSTNKGRRLKRNLFRFAILGFLGYIAVFFFVWQFLTDKHSFSYR